MKCYIAGRISGLEETEFKQRFLDGKKEVEKLGFEAVNPVDLPHEHGRSWEEYMRECLMAMLQCQTVYALNNWRYSVGATIEVNLAVSLGISVIFQKSESSGL